MISYNIRRLGSGVKKREESKLEVVDDITYQSLWGEGNVGWAFKKSEGRSEGIISLWDADKFPCLSSWDMNGVLVVNGLWSQDGSACCIINVYAPCNLVKRLELWDRIHTMINQNLNVCIYILGDFNSVMNGIERWQDENLAI
ncbi:hypothetical protein ACS0TY_008244 [Phlomoides rotata]